MQEAGDRPDPGFETAPVYPTTVTIAGIVWILFGGVIFLNLLVLLLLMYADAAGGQVGAAVAGGVCGGLIIGLFGAAFIFVGVQSVRGTARDTLGNGIGSIIFGLLNFGSGGLQASGGHMIQAGIGFLAGVGLLTAGILALVGRGDYKTWRKAQKARSGEQLNR
jgi:hypothetical protein